MKLNNLQVLRAVAAYAVLLVHLDDVERKYANGTLLGLWTEAFIWGVDLFFVLSGFVMVLVSLERSGSAETSLRFLCARIARIYPLWWLCLSALVVVWLIRPELVYGGNQKDVDLIKDYMLFPRSEAPLLEVGWTLIYEMYFYIVFATLLLLPIGHWVRLPLLALWVTVALSYGSIYPPEEYGLLAVLTSPFILEFAFGSLAAYIWHATKGACGFTSILCGTIWLTLGTAAFILMQNETGQPYQSAWQRVFMFGPGSAMLVYGAAAIEIRNQIRAHGLFVNLGDWSYSIYLTHMLSLNALALALSQFAQPGLWDNVVTLCLLIFGVTSISAMTYYLFEVPVLKRSRRAVDSFLPKAENSPTMGERTM